MTCKGLSSYVKRTGLESGPLSVEVRKEIEKVVACLSGRSNGIMLRLTPRESHTQRLIDKNCMSDDVPGVAGFLDAIFGDSDGSVLCECSELRTGPGSTLQPEDEGHFSVGFGGGVSHSREHAIIHGGLSLGVVPIYLFVA